MVMVVLRKLRSRAFVEFVVANPTTLDVLAPDCFSCRRLLWKESYHWSFRDANRPLELRGQWMAVQRVGICGIGVVSGYGWGRELLWDGLVAGTPAATATSGLGSASGDTMWVARVPDGRRPPPPPHRQP